MTAMTKTYSGSKQQLAETLGGVAFLKNYIDASFMLSAKLHRTGRNSTEGKTVKPVRLRYHSNLQQQ